MYNNYYGRTPYYIPNYQQPIMPQQPVQQVPEMVFNDVRILTADQIKGFIPPINSKVLLIDKDNKIAYVETTDNMGNMYKQPYSFNLLQGEQKEEKSDYVTKAELNSAIEEVKGLVNRQSYKKPNAEEKN